LKYHHPPAIPAHIPITTISKIAFFTVFFLK
jgi:hypothetical protein